MKKTILTFLSLFACLITFPVRSHAQDLAGNFLKAGLSDANKLLGAYLGTTTKGLGQGLNDGWHNTAKPLGKGGLDLRVNVGVGIVPQRDQTFNFNEIGLNTDHSKPYIVLAPGSDPNQPTLYGSAAPNYTKAQVHGTINDRDTVLTEFVLPSGGGYGYSPAIPIIQLSVGLIKNTELNIRYYSQNQVPKDYNIHFFGIG